MNHSDLEFYLTEFRAARWFFQQRQNRGTYQMLDHARRNLRRCQHKQQERQAAIPALSKNQPTQTL